MNKTLIKKYHKKLIAEAKASGHPRPTLADAEQSIVNTVIRVAKTLAPSHRFGYHDIEDIEQQGALFALEALEAGVYDVGRPLENFLHVHVKNRLINFKRNHFIRSEAPCKCCEPFPSSGVPANPCKRWLDWNRRNSAKQNLMCPIDVDNVEDECESNMRREIDLVSYVELRDLQSLLDRNLPVPLRADYLRLLGGEPVPKARKDRLIVKIKEIVFGVGAEGKSGDEKTEA